MLQPERYKSSRPWVPAVVFLLFTAGLTWIGWQYFLRERNHLTKQIRAQLSSIADITTEQIAQWRQDRMTDAIVIQQNPLVMEALSDFLRGDRSRQDDIQAWLGHLRTSYDFLDALIADHQGRVFLTVGESEQKTGPYLQRFIREALRTRRVLLTDLHTAGHVSTVHLDLVIPITDADEAEGSSFQGGALVMRIDPHRYLFTLTKEWPTDSRTAESILVRRDNDQVVYLDTLRHDPDRPPMSHRQTLSAHLPAALAVMGQTGMVEGTDYRGVRVLAALRQIPGTPWAMVSKIDQAEVYAQLVRRGTHIALLFGLFVLLGGLILYAWWARQKAGFFRRQYETERDRDALVRHYDYLSRYANDIILLTDAESRMVEVNDRALETYGYTRDEMIGMDFARLRPARIRDGIAEQIERAKQLGGLLYETVHCRKDGSEFPIEASLRVIQVEDATYVQGIFRDITERKTAEKKIMNLTRMYAVLSEINQCIVRTRDRDSLLDEICRIIVDFGKFKLAWIGFADETGEALKPRFVHGLQADQICQMRFPTQDTDQGEGPCSTAFRLGVTVVSNEASKDPRMRRFQDLIDLVGFASVASVPLRFHEKVIGVLTVYAAEAHFFDDREIGLLDEVGLDISFALDSIDREHRRTETEARLERAYQDLKTNETKYRSLFEASNDAIFLLEDGRVADCNRRGLELFGVQHELLIGQSLGEISPLYQADGRLSGDRINELLKDVLAGNPQHFLWKYQHPLGELVDVDVSLERIEWEGRVRVQAIVRDLRDQLRTEAEKRQLQHELLQAQKMEAIGKLAGGVAHDFNNLLMVIKGNAELLAPAVRADGAEELKEIENAADRAAALTRQLLAFSRKQSLEPKIIRIDSLIELMQRMLRRLIGENIRLELDLSKDIAAVKADPGQIEQVVMNLVVNARDAMPEGGSIVISCRNRELTADDTRRMKAAQPGRFVCVSIRDTGIGIPANIIDNIFEPFFTTKGREKGTGLGLSVVYGIVKQHGGQVQVHSEPGHGTIMEVFLPACPETPVSANDANPQADVPSGRGERILVVEDNRELRNLCVRMLRENGYTVLEAGNAAEAEAALASETKPIDLLFTDVVLPDGGGLKLADRARQRIPHIRVLLTSGYSDERANWDALRREGFPLLHKPYEIRALYRLVRDILDRKPEQP